MIVFLIVDQTRKELIHRGHRPGNVDSRSAVSTGNLATRFLAGNGQTLAAFRAIKVDIGFVRLQTSLLTVLNRADNVYSIIGKQIMMHEHRFGLCVSLSTFLSRHVTY